MEGEWGSGSCGWMSVGQQEGPLFRTRRERLQRRPAESWSEEAERRLGEFFMCSFNKYRQTSTVCGTWWEMLGHQKVMSVPTGRQVVQDRTAEIRRIRRRWPSVEVMKEFQTEVLSLKFKDHMTQKYKGSWLMQILCVWWGGRLGT